MTHHCPCCHGCQPVPPVLPHTLAPDLLRSAKEISEFLYGTPNETRKVYNLAETSKIPIFRLGAVLHARRSVLLEWIESQERRGMQPEAAEPADGTERGFGRPRKPPAPGH